MIVGTKSGDIYYVSVEVPPEFSNKEPDVRDHIHQIYSANDHQVPKEVDFDRLAERVVYLSQQGELTVWTLQPLEMNFAHKFHAASVRLMTC